MAAIYQRARPITFDQVVGQEHVKDVLVAAIRSGRTGHAYLFSGPRGVGKTTTARLLAMALNCETNDADPKPCGVCDACRMVQEGNHPDVIELDAASNNSVEDVRDLREKVRLASIRGGTRVWILDEAHMLSRAAANALLKTLEEPPPRLAFVLATTEPEKLPPTILSRCQHYRFRRLSEAEIAGKLGRLCDEAGAPAEPEALALVARSADGAMRDAESLLERLLAPQRPITLADAEAALGLPPQTRLEALATALATGDLTALFGEANALYHDGFAPRSIAEQLLLALQHALRAALLDEGPGLPLERPALMRVIHALDEERGRFTRRDDLASLEVALIKTRNALTGNLPAAASPESAAAAAAPAPVLPAFEPNRPAHPRRAPAAAAAEASTAPAAEPPPASPAASPRLSWHEVKTRAGAQLKAFLMPAREEFVDGVLTVRYGETHRFHFNELKKRGDELSDLVAEIAGAPLTIRIEGPGETVTKKA